jgi:uncharacterized protein
MTTNAPGASRNRILVTSLAGLLLVLALVAAYLVGVVRSDRASASTTATGSAAGPAAAQVSGVAGGGSSGSRTAAAAADTPGSATAAAGITVSGTGTATGTPDTLALDLAVTTTAPTVTKALEEANASASAVQKSLSGHAVAAKDLQTSGLSIQAMYDNKGQSITGYQVSESVHAVVHGLARVGETITDAVSAGGNSVRVNNIGLDLGDSAPLMTQARDSAFTQARAKAEQYAKAAGTTLGKVVSITDAAVSGPVGVRFDAASAADKAALSPVPIQAGSQDVQVTVTVVFALA